MSNQQPESPKSADYTQTECSAHSRDDSNIQQNGSQLIMRRPIFETWASIKTC